ncbi:Uncharacterised protein [Jonesia denitrificans]|nr:Uncharacterised protein [Jonesia denitrificans]
MFRPQELGSSFEGKLLAEVGVLLQLSWQL